MRGRQLPGGGVPDRAGRRQAGDQDDVRALASNGDGDPVIAGGSGRRSKKKCVGVVAAEHADGGEKRDHDREPAEPRMGFAHGLVP
jgi:hypothetical protein